MFTIALWIDCVVKRKKAILLILFLFNGVLPSRSYLCGGFPIFSFSFFLVVNLNLRGNGKVIVNRSFEWVHCFVFYDNWKGLHNNNEFLNIKSLWMPLSLIKLFMNCTYKWYMYYILKLHTQYEWYVFYKWGYISVFVCENWAVFMWTFCRKLE